MTGRSSLYSAFQRFPRDPSSPWARARGAGGWQGPHSPLSLWICRHKRGSFHNAPQIRRAPGRAYPSPAPPVPVPQLRCATLWPTVGPPAALTSPGLQRPSPHVAHSLQGSVPWFPSCLPNCSLLSFLPKCWGVSWFVPSPLPLSHVPLR